MRRRSPRRENHYHQEYMLQQFQENHLWEDMVGPMTFGGTLVIHLNNIIFIILTIIFIIILKTAYLVFLVPGKFDMEVVSGGGLQSLDQSSSNIQLHRLLLPPDEQFSLYVMFNLLKLDSIQFSLSCLHFVHSPLFSPNEFVPHSIELVAFVHFHFLVLHPSTFPLNF